LKELLVLVRIVNALLIPTAGVSLIKDVPASQIVNAKIAAAKIIQFASSSKRLYPIRYTHCPLLSINMGTGTGPILH
jgi:hypothetical protein